MLRARSVRVIAILLALALTLAAVSLPAMSSRVLCGQNGPIPGAVVRLRATGNATTTDGGACHPGA